MTLLTRANGIQVMVNADKVLFAQPFRSTEQPQANSQIYFSSSDYISLRDTFDEVISRLAPTVLSSKSGEIGAV